MNGAAAAPGRRHVVPFESGANDASAPRRNLPGGWAGYRALRQVPARVKARRHGNWKHGERSRETQLRSAATRLVLRLIRQGVALPRPPPLRVGMWRAGPATSAR